MKIFDNIFEKKEIPPKTSSEEKLQQIQEILFPPLKSYTDKEGRKFHIDYCADTNLQAALHDLEDDFNDENTRKTIKSVEERIINIRKVLEFGQPLDDDAEYVIADDLENNYED
jgi:hypothetical protein